MAKFNAKPLSAWEDRFRTPSLAELRAAQPNKTLGQVLEHARERLAAFEGVKSEIAWQGIPWRWTIVFHPGDDEGLPLAYLVPEPGKLQVAVPLRREFAGTLPVKRLPRVIRDRIVFASEVAGILWPRFEFSTKGQFDEIEDLIRRKRAFSSETAAT